MKTKLLTYLKSDEKKAPMQYRRLLHQVHTKADKKVIRGIISDERRHFRLLKRMGKK